MAVSTRAPSTGLSGRKLIAVLLIITLIPLGLIGLLTLRLARESIRNEVEARARSNAAVTATLIQQYMTGLGSIVESFARRPALVSALNSSSPANVDKQQIAFHLHGLAEASEGISLAFLAEM